MLSFKIFQILIMPSVLIIFAFLIALFFIYKKFCLRAAKIVLTVAIICYYLFSIAPIADMLTAPLIIQPAEAEYSLAVKINKIVLLTGSVSDRANEALRIYYLINKNNNKAMIFISGTSAINPSDFQQAVKTKNFLIDRGVPEASIIMEVNSRNTLESAQNMSKIIGQEPFFLITSAYHLRRAMFAFENFGLNPIPASPELSVKKHYRIFDFFPCPENLQKVDWAAHEYLGLLYYQVKL